MSPLHCLVLASTAERRRALAEPLRSGGHPVVAAAEGREAAEAISVPGLDVLVVDLALPLLDLAALQRALDAGAPAAPESLEAAERRHIARVLEFTGGNRRRAAQILGIARSTMLAKLRKYGLDQEIPG